MAPPSRFVRHRDFNRRSESPSAPSNNSKASNPFSTEFPRRSFFLNKDYQLIGNSTLDSARPILKVYDDKAGKYYAVKMFMKAHLLDRGRKAIEQTNEEARILRKLSHPFITAFIASWQSTNKLYIAMEYLPGGEVFDLWKVILYGSTSLLRFFAAQAALALDYLHSMKIIYRDLKMENMLLDAQGYMKFVDFGASKQMQSAKTYTICGTLAYAAPEMLNGEGYDYSVDWWSLGVFSYAFTCGDYPVRPTNDHKEMRRLVNQYDLEVPQGTDATLVHFIMQLLKKNPQRRLAGCSNVKKLDFFRGKIDFLALEQKLYDAREFYTESDISRLPDGRMKEWVTGVKSTLGSINKSPPPNSSNPKIPKPRVSSESEDRFDRLKRDESPPKGIIKRKAHNGDAEVNGTPNRVSSSQKRLDSNRIVIQRARDPPSLNEDPHSSDPSRVPNSGRKHVTWGNLHRVSTSHDKRISLLREPVYQGGNLYAISKPAPSRTIISRNVVPVMNVHQSAPSVILQNVPRGYLSERSPKLYRQNSGKFLRAVNLVQPGNRQSVSFKGSPSRVCYALINTRPQTSRIPKENFYQPSSGHLTLTQLR